MTAEDALIPSGLNGAKCFRAAGKAIWSERRGRGHVDMGWTEGSWTDVRSTVAEPVPLKARRWASSTPWSKASSSPTLSVRLHLKRGKF